MAEFWWNFAKLPRALDTCVYKKTDNRSWLSWVKINQFCFKTGVFLKWPVIQRLDKFKSVMNTKRECCTLCACILSQINLFIIKLVVNDYDQISI